MKSPGKVIISGEHSVVYHYPALVMAVNLYTQARCTVFKPETIKSFVNFSIEQEITGEIICCHQWPASEKTGTLKEQRLIDYIMNDLSISSDVCGKIKVQISSEIPIGSGLGSSAAYSVALSTALFLGLMIL